MPLPPVAFFSIYEIAVRWGCPPADVAGWAAAGHLHVVAGIPPVLCGDETVAGMVQVPMAELEGYESQLKSMTAGLGSYSVELSHYDPVPSDIQQKLHTAYKKQQEN